MFDQFKKLTIEKHSTEQAGLMVDQLKTNAKDLRRNFERRWYDNNFFDDGFHFRYLSRQQNKIVDMSEKANLYSPYRAIPKASKQIRGIANLLMSPKYTPVVYPKKVLKENYASMEEYQQAREEAKMVAKRSGHWIEDQFKEQELLEKIALMLILAQKHGVSFMKVWPDAVKEKLNTAVRDAFEIYLIGSLNSIYESPFIIESVPRLVSEIKADETFNPEYTSKITPDNKLASSEIKDAYARTRFGNSRKSDASITVIQNECFKKEYLTPELFNRISVQENAAEVLKDKKMGDMVMRHIFTAGNIGLKDEYIALDEYPFIDFRMEPGPIYQVPQIERFIPTNKSLDMAVSRVERFFHTMNTGAWLKRQGEQIEFNNQAGGQVIEYSQTPPVQAQISSPSAMTFPFIQYLSSLIDEQGVSTSTLNKIPNGVKANAAIESLKESEYASLLISQERLKGTVRRIAETFMMYADDYFVNPQTVYLLQKGEPDYFDVIGETALKKRQELGITDNIPQQVVPISGECVVDIEVEEGLAFTSEGRKDRAKQVMDSIQPYVESGIVPPQAFKMFMQNWLETWQYGSISDIMDAMDDSQLTQQMSNDQMTQMKTAVLEALQDAQEIGPKATEKRIMENKIGVIEALKDTGIAKKILTDDKQQEVKAPSESISFKDLPPEGQAQMAAQAGINITPKQIEDNEDEEMTEPTTQSR